MAIKRFERYPGRYLDATNEQPQGAFKDRTSPNANDGSYLQADWLNDFSGFFSALLDASGEVPSGVPDTAIDSQYLRGMQSFIPKNTIKWESEAVLSNGFDEANPKWCKVAKLTPDNNYFSGLFTVNFIESTLNINRSVTFFVMDGFTTSSAESQKDAFLFCFGGSGGAGNALFLRVVHYTSAEAYLEIKIEKTNPTETNAFPVDCNGYVFSGVAEVIESLDVSDITVNVPSQDQRIKAYTNVQSKRLKYNDNSIFHSSDYPIAQIYQHGLVQLSNDLVTPDAKGNEKTATLNAIQALKAEVDALKNSDATNFAGDAKYFDLIAQRGMDIDYVNNTSNMIQVFVSSRNNTGACEVEISVDGLPIARSYTTYSNYKTMFVTAVVPVGSTYRVTGNSLHYWKEFRSEAAPVGAKLEDQVFYSADGKVFKASDEKLSDEQVAAAGYTLAHLDYQAFENERQKNKSTEE